jgi:hypothetical protein
MTSISRSLLLSATLLAAPLTGAVAQDSNPTGNYGSNRSVTASPGTADGKTDSKMSTGDVHSRSVVGSYHGSASNPGGTGRTAVPGSNSSQARAAAGTAATQAGGTGGGGK